MDESQPVFIFEFRRIALPSIEPQMTIELEKLQGAREDHRI